MMDFINDWWKLMVICISAIPTIILFIIKGRISHWFNKDLEDHRSELDQKARKIQSSLDTQIEMMRIEFSLIQSERLQILKETCNRITKMLNQINIISSYFLYDCKESVDYEAKCTSDGVNCFDDCLVHYWEKVVQFDKYTRETSDFLDSNQMFFPVEVSIKHLEVITILFELRKNAYDISFDRKYTKRERALKTFELFHNFNKTGISELRQKLIDEYRLLIGVSPSKTVSTNEYRLISELSERINRIGNKDVHIQ